MSEHGDAFSRLHRQRLDKLSKPVFQGILIKGAVAGVIRLVLAHLQWTMAERHNLPRHPANDGVNSVKSWSQHRLRQEFNPPNGNSKFFRQAAERHFCRPTGLVGWRTIDKNRHPLCCAGCRDVLAVEKSAGPVLHRLDVWYFWVPVGLAAVERNTTAGC